MDNPSVGEAITLALTPIFLLVGIGGLLNVMTARLARVVDRARILEAAMEAGEEEEQYKRHSKELRALGSRIYAVNRAIYATSTSALFVCVVVALLFVEQLFNVPVTTVVALIFIAMMGTLIVGLGFFLKEIQVASKSLKVRRELLR